MAGHKGTRTGPDAGTSKFRLIVLEADLATGELSHFAHAITNALRPAATHQQPRLAAPPTVTDAPQNGTPLTSSDSELSALDAETPIETATDGTQPSSSPRKERKRSYRDPKISDSLDLRGTTGITWVQFAKAKNPQSRQKRFLAAMSWFKNHGGKPAIGIDDVYTAFRTPGVDWPYAFQDYDKVFRALVGQDLASRTETGLYAINVVGEGKVDKKGDD